MPLLDREETPREREGRPVGRHLSVATYEFSKRSKSQPQVGTQLTAEIRFVWPNERTARLRIIEVKVGARKAGEEEQRKKSCETHL